MVEKSLEGLTEQQRKWFASVKANMESKTGKSLAEWVAIARTCPHDRPRARQAWLKEHHGLGINHASFVLSEAFPPEGPSWDDAAALRAELWTDPASTAILEAVERAVADLPDVIKGQRKGFSAFCARCSSPRSGRSRAARRGWAWASRPRRAHGSSRRRTRAGRSG